jgi:hypothetical protein
LSKAFRYSEAWPLSEGVVAAARKLNHPVLLGEALIYRGNAQRLLQGGNSGDPVLKEAAIAGRRGADDECAARAWINVALADVDAYRFADADRWLAYAAAAFERMGADLSRFGLYHEVLANVQQGQGASSKRWRRFAERRPRTTVRGGCPPRLASSPMSAPTWLSSVDSTTPSAPVAKRWASSNAASDEPTPRRNIRSIASVL